VSARYWLSLQDSLPVANWSVRRDWTSPAGSNTEPAFNRSSSLQIFCHTIVIERYSSAAIATDIVDRCSSEICLGSLAFESFLGGQDEGGVAVSAFADYRSN
jgi:hypothetical protein